MSDHKNKIINKPIIIVKDLCKEFKIPEKKQKGFWSNIKDIFYRKWTTKKVLKGISFEINKGEFVGYVGANGAGKSTTIKALTGVLTPTSGLVKCAGHTPYIDRYKYTYNIGVVFGQRRLLEFDLPVIESLKLFKEIYELDQKFFDERIKYFSKILKIDKLLHIPVRKLSLGERMRCEIAASLIHKPRIVFLDEPTIGLDALAKEEIRKFLKEINKNEKTTIILTTHDMDDIEETCKRIIMIDDGKKIYDGPLHKLKQKYITEKTIDIEFSKIKNKRTLNTLKKSSNIVKDKQNYLCLRVPSKEINKRVEQIMSSLDVIDLTIREPRLEHVIKKIYKGIA